jgi:hypothetical protein
MLRIKIILTLGFIFIGISTLHSEYRSTELCVIPWGEENNGIRISEPYREYSDDINGDTIGYMETGDGPDYLFVDKSDNIYIKSSSLGYLKGFHPDGMVFINYSPNNGMFDYGSYFGRLIEDFYVDSLCRLYANSIFQNYIAVVDTAYNLIEKIRPDFIDSTDYITITNRGSNDALSITTGHSGCLTYKNNQFYESGTFYGWLAADSNYYYVLSNADSVLRVVRFNSINKRCYAQAYDSVFAFDMREIIGCHLLGVTDSMLLGVIYNPYADSLNDYIRFYDTTGEILDQFSLLPQVENQYLYYIYEPFFRADGSVYQFLCEDDGLHVIKWSKQ